MILLVENEIRMEERGVEMWENIKGFNIYVKFFMKCFLKYDWILS